MKNILLILFIVCISYSATIDRYVRTTVSGGAGDGTSWADAYSSIDGALISYTDTNLVGDGNIVIFHCAGADPDTGFSILYTRYLCDSTNYVKITADSSNYEIVVEDKDAVTVTAQYTWLDKLKIKTESVTTTRRVVTIMYYSAKLTNCIIEAQGTGSAACTGIYFSNANVGYIINCVVISPSSSTWGVSSNSAVLVGSGSSGARIYSSTLIGGLSGVYRSAGTVIAKNCYAHAFASGYTAYEGTMTLTTCASSDATGSASLQNIDYSTSAGAYFNNTTNGSQDYSIKTGSEFIGEGTNTSGDTYPLNFTDDILGAERDSTWIGAYHYDATCYSSVVTPIVEVALLNDSVTWDHNITNSPDSVAIISGTLPDSLVLTKTGANIGRIAGRIKDTLSKTAITIRAYGCDGDSTGDAIDTISCKDTTDFYHVTYLLIGNSIMEGFPGFTGPENGGPSGDTASQFGPYFIDERGGIGDYYNAGIHGNTTDEIRDRLDSLQLKHTPDTTIVEGGINDIGTTYDSDEYVTALDSMRIISEANSSIMWVMQMTPWGSADQDSLKRWNAKSEKWCDTNNIKMIFVYQDYCDTIVDKDTAMLPAYGTLHLTVPGYAHSQKLFANPAIPDKFRWGGHPNYPNGQYESWRQWVGPKTITGSADTGTYNLVTDDTLSSPVLCYDTSVHRLYITASIASGTVAYYYRESANNFTNGSARAWTLGADSVDINSQFVQIRLKCLTDADIKDVKVSWSPREPSFIIDSISPLKGKAGYTLSYYCTNLIDSSSSVFAKINNFTLDSLIKWSNNTVQVVIPIDAPRGTYTNPWLGHVPIADTVRLDTAATPYKNYKMGSE